MLESDSNHRAFFTGHRRYYLVAGKFPRKEAGLRAQNILSPVEKVWKKPDFCKKIKNKKQRSGHNRCHVLS